VADTDRLTLALGITAVDTRHWRGRRRRAMTKSTFAAPTFLGAPFRQLSAGPQLCWLYSPSPRINHRPAMDS
jgi:hypothetical protein